RHFTAHLDDRGELERLTLLDRIGLLDARLGDRREVVLLVRLEERLAHELVRDLGVDARSVDLLEHGTRDLALAETLEGDTLAELLVRLVELRAHGLPGDLDEHLLLDGRDFFDANLHRGRCGYHITFAFDTSARPRRAPPVRSGLPAQRIRAFWSVLP